MKEKSKRKKRIGKEKRVNIGKNGDKKKKRARGERKGQEDKEEVVRERNG